MASNTETYQKELEAWQDFFSNTKRHPLSDYLHKYFNITLCLYDVEGKRRTSSSISKFCHAMHNNSQAQDCCTNFIRNLVAQPQQGAATNVCPWGIVNVVVPVRYGDHNIASIVCNNMVLKDSFVPQRLRETYNLKIVTTEELQQLCEFLMILSNLVHLPNAAQPSKKAALQQTPFKDLGLTRREQEIANLLIMGYSNRKISEELYITEATVKTHVSNILSKLELQDRNQLIKKYGNA